MGRTHLRLLACGGRDYNDRVFVYATLDRIHARRLVVLVIAGGKLPPCESWERARGADLLALEWARERGIPYEGYPANWPRFGPAAGPKRNREQRDRGRPDVVVAFPGGRGTADMVAAAGERNIPVFYPAPQSSSGTSTGA
jgi:hypothetical protein